MMLVRLAHDKAEVIPDGITVLNPEAEGSRPFIYLMWATSLVNPIDFDEALEGWGPCEPFAFFSESPNLHLAARKNATRTSHDGASRSLREMHESVSGKLDERGMTGEALALCFFRVDSLGGPTPLGVTPVFEVTR